MARSARRVRPLLVVTGAGLAVSWALRRPMLDWGATQQEAEDALPGDELLPGADIVATRAISIGAPPEEVWPWLVQLGTGRAGGYSYDWLDRLAGLNMVSSWRIIPEFQDLAIGDIIPVDNAGEGLRVHRLEPARVLGTRTDDGTWAWTWVLREDGPGTRLLSRTRMDTRRSPPWSRLLTYELLIPASFAMERKMLLGLRERAETRGVRPTPTPRSTSRTRAPRPTGLPPTCAAATSRPSSLDQPHGRGHDLGHDVV